MVSTCPLISKSLSSYTSPLVTMLSALIISGITVTYIFSSFSPFSSKVSVLITLFAFIVLSSGQPDRKSRLFGRSSFFLFLFFFFFFFFCLLLGLVVWPRFGDLFYLKISKNFLRLIFWTDSGLCIYHLFVWPNLNFLHKS